MDNLISLKDLKDALISLSPSGAEYHHLGQRLEWDMLIDTSCLVARPNNPYKVVSRQKTQLGPNPTRTIEEMAQEIARETIGSGHPDPDLDTDVHPLLAREKWTDITDEEWEVVLPSLRLATMFLTTPACWEFYEHVVSADIMLRTKVMESGEVVDETHMARPQVEPTTEQKRAAMMQVMDAMLNHVRFHFDKEPPAPGAYRYYGVFRNPNIFLSYRTFMLLKHARDASLSSLTRRFRCALTLLHEIAHAFNVGVHWKAMQNGREPRYSSDEPWSELGYSWERTILGYPSAEIKKSGEFWENYTHPLMNNAATVVELSQESIKEACQRYSPEFDNFDDGAVRRVLPSKLIPQMFLKRTWEKMAAEGLGFIQQEAGTLRIETRQNQPAPNWTTVYFNHPDSTDVTAVCFRQRGHAAVAGVLFKLSRKP